uniref:Uncharacterized protein n=1 Tax=Oryza punctata TaxID=4537 RepID=A0A0E0K0C1_ORYPU
MDMTPRSPSRSTSCSSTAAPLVTSGTTRLLPVGDHPFGCDVLLQAAKAAEEPRPEPSGSPLVEVDGDGMGLYAEGMGGGNGGNSSAVA